MNYVVANYLSKIICIDNAHIRIKTCSCKKEFGSLCNLCTQNLKSFTYVYMCKQCYNTYCLNDFACHQDNIIFAWHQNVVKLLHSGETIQLLKPIMTCAQAISVGNRIFLFNADGIQSFMELSIHLRSLIERKSMIAQKWQFSLCSFNNNIGCIGGSDGVVKSSCEKYDLLCDKWTLLPSMIQKRVYAAVFSYRNSYIYALGGFSSKSMDSCTDSMEMLKLGSKYWVNMNIEAHSQLIGGARYMNAIQITNDKILIFGFNKGKGECYYFGMKNHKMIKGSDMEDNGMIKNLIAPVCYGRTVYSIDNSINTFDVKKSKWSKITI